MFSSLGSFNDFERLFQQIEEQPVIELGNPLPLEKFQRRKRAGHCPATHNEALFGKPPR